MLLELLESICENNQTKIVDFFSPNVTLSQSLQTFASCYQNNLMVIIPALFLFVFFPILLFALHKSKNPKLEVCSPVGGRITIGIILITITAVQFFYNTYRKWYLSKNIPLSWIYSTGVRYISLCFALFLTLACRNRGIVTSGVLFNYWLLLLVCSIPEFIGKYNYYFDKSDIFKNLFNNKLVEFGSVDDNLLQYSTIQNILFIIYFPLLIVQVILSCFVDTPKYHVTNEKECPEYYTSFLNQITFDWFTPMAYTGFKRALTADDLWNLNSSDESKNVVSQFNKNFNNEMKKFAMKKIRKQKREKRHGKIIKLEEQKLTNENQVSSKAKKDSEENTDAPSVLWPLFLTFKMTFIGSGFYKLLFDLLQFVSPKLLSVLINFIQDKQQPLWIGLTISIVMFLVALFQSMVLHQYFHNMFRLGMNIRSALISTVYRKALFLSNTSRRKMTVGEIVNIMSVDIQRFQDMTTFVMLFWSAPLQVLLSIYFLWDLMGVSVFAGLVVLLLMVPLNSFISVKMRDCQVKHMKLKDERMKMVNEVIGGIKVLKLYNWENSLQETITGIRKKELSNLKQFAYLHAATSLSWSSAPFLVAVITFGVYVTIDPQNNVLTPQITFVALALFNILRFPLAIFAMIFAQAIQCYVSNKRLKSFLAADEIDPNDIETRITSSGKALTIKDASFAWIKEMDPFLKNINLSIEKESLVAIVGRTGSGKSSLLSALLGEMTKEKGSVHINGSIAYVPQQAWIQNLSLKDNILFNKTYDEKLYNKVIDSCSLRQDFEALPNSDLTEIGEKGINLSGGQKQRVNLARAIYADKDIYVIDDALSAVDAHVGKHIFDNVLSTNNGLLKDKTRILVTHSLHLLKYCDYIYVMKDGSISEEGNYSQLIKNNGELAELLEEFLIEEAKTRGRSVSFGEDAEEVKEVLDHLEGIDPIKKRRIEKEILKTVEEIHTSSENIFDKEETLSQGNDSGEKETSKLLDKSNENKPNNVESLTKGQIIQKEGVETGKVKLSVYVSYFKAIGLFCTFKFIFIYLLSSILGVLSNLWLADWSDNAKQIQSSNNTDETNQRLAIYTFLGLSQAGTVSVASIIMALGMVSASGILHQSMLIRILRSPMSFFDITPIGRILNRFGKDIELLDNRLPGAILSLTYYIIGGSTTIVVPIIITPYISVPLIPVLMGYIFLLDIEGLDAAIPRSFVSFIRTVVSSLEILTVIVLVTPWFGVILIPLVIIYFLVLRFYVNTSRQLKRLESTTRSPIYSHFQESVQGAASIRAYGVVENFVYESNKRVDQNLITYYPSIVANRWLAVRLELVGNLIVLFAALFSVFGREGSGITAGLVGLSVAYALNVTQTLNWAVRMTSELETNIVAVERIKEYAELETEADTKTNPTIIQLPTNWPNEGHIVIRNISLRYRKDLDPVLRGISVEIDPKEKIGIVGRTGAGKSSLTLALFRIVELDEGSIIIDGIDISKIGLDDLRSRITIVPQDPMLFSGTLRDNLDPFHKYNDDSIWRALQLTHLDAFVTALPNQLEHQIAESGTNLSVGQRQLLCLARALLRKSSILLLDEASASVDVETDQLIQRTIQEQFGSCTVLTIAHRLNTIKNSNRILVLDKGSVAEFDTPEKLLANPNGIFRSLMKEANLLSENY